LVIRKEEKIIFITKRYSGNREQRGPAELHVLGGCAAENRGADFVEHLVPSPSAPEQGTRPDTAHHTIELRLLARHTAPVSTAIIDNTESQL
jgi:hypothetical protein